MRYKILQAYKDHTIELMEICPQWIRSLISEGEADCFYLVAKEEDQETLAGYIALQSEDVGAQILAMSADDEFCFSMLFRRVRQYMQERGLESLIISQVLDENQKKDWEKLLYSQNFTLDEGQKYCKVRLSEIENCSLFEKNAKVDLAVESGRIRPVLGLEGKELDSLINLMQKTHPAAEDKEEFGTAIPELSEVYVHNNQVLAYVFMSLYKDQLFVQECGAQKSMELLILALINNTVCDISSTFKESDSFYIPIDGDLGRSHLFKKMLEREDFKPDMAQEHLGYWDWEQDMAISQVKSLLDAKFNQEEYDTDAIIIARTEQLHDLLNDMDRENLVTFFREKPCIQTWFNSKGQEETIYLSYYLINVNLGFFALEAIVPLKVCQNDEEAVKICHNFNKISPSCSVFEEDGRIYLRMSLMEHEIPVNYDQMTYFIEDLITTWERIYPFYQI